MILYRKFHVPVNDLIYNVDFGMADNIEEIQSIYKLRYEIYSSRGYIDSTRFPDQIEMDEYDINKKCTYFLMKYNNQVFGTVRLIKDDPLPTEIDYLFQEPSIISSIPRNQRAEFSRLIIKPLDKNNKIYLPKGYAMLVLLDVLLEYCEKNNIKGGYSFIKSSLEKKMSRNNMPIIKINPFVLRYPETGILYKYFKQESDPVVPIAYLVADFKEYLSKKFSNYVFDHKGMDIYVKNNLLVKFLRLINYN